MGGYMNAQQQLTQAGQFGRSIFFIFITLLPSCSLTKSDEKAVVLPLALRTVDGQTISRPEYDDYNPMVMKLSDGYLGVAFGSDRPCSGCTGHNIFFAKSATVYNDNGVLPYFQIPQPVKASGVALNNGAPISFALAKGTTSPRLYVNNSAGEIVYSDITNGSEISGLSPINNSQWKTMKIVGTSTNGTNIFARDAMGKIYLFNPGSTDTTLTPLSSAMNTQSIAQINPAHVPKQDSFITLQGNMVQSASYIGMGGPVTGLNLAVGQAKIQIKSISILSGPTRQSEIIFLSGNRDGNPKQDMFLAEGATPTLLWDQTFPKPGDQNFAPPPFAGSFTTFQQATVVLGAFNFTSKGTTGTYDVIDMDAGAGKIYLSQKTGAKLRVFNTMPSVNGALEDYMLTGYNGGIAVDGPTMIRSNNTTLTGDLEFFNPTPMSGGAFPGATFTQGTTGATCAQTEFANSNEQIEASNNKLILNDVNNHRLMLWNSIPTSGGQNANIVLGQANFTSCTYVAVTQVNLKNPGKPWTNGQRVAVADTQHNRVLIWNNFPGANGQAADLVLGQPNFTSGAPNNGGVTASSMNLPTAVSSDGNRFAVLDKGNNRVLIWNNFPTASNIPANVVLGQSDFSKAAANDDNQDGADDNASNPASGRVFKSPSAILLLPDALLVADFAHERVLIFKAQ